MRAKIHTQGKQFGMIGMMFAGTECLLGKCFIIYLENHLKTKVFL